MPRDRLARSGQLCRAPGERFGDVGRQRLGPGGALSGECGCEPAQKDRWSLCDNAHSSVAHGCRAAAPRNEYAPRPVSLVKKPAPHAAPGESVALALRDRSGTLPSRRAGRTALRWGRWVIGVGIGLLIPRFDRRRPVDTSQRGAQTFALDARRTPRPSKGRQKLTAGLPYPHWAQRRHRSSRWWRPLIASAGQGTAAAIAPDRHRASPEASRRNPPGHCVSSLRGSRFLWTAASRPKRTASPQRSVPASR